MHDDTRLRMVFEQFGNPVGGVYLTMETAEIRRLLTAPRIPSYPPAGSRSVNEHLCEVTAPRRRIVCDGTAPAAGAPRLEIYPIIRDVACRGSR
jgi:hypothetical protein